MAISESWQQKAIHDTLTGLHNRAYFENILADEWQRFGKFDRPFVVAMLDIDHFKSVNDVHGHAAGDQVLRLLATTLPHSLRQIDTVCRYGGEEFALLLPGTRIDEAKIILERLRLTIQSLVIPFESKNLQITVSIDVATSKHDMEDQNELIMVADRQLYRAKDLGRNRVECKDS
nr:GGDEF domain-containing protein [uncultured Undibacterium sp.]